MRTLYRIISIVALSLCFSSMSEAKQSDLKSFIQTLIASAKVDSLNRLETTSFPYVEDRKDRKPAKFDPLGVATFLGAPKPLCDEDGFDARIALTCEYPLLPSVNREELAAALRKALAETIARHAKELHKRPISGEPPSRENGIDFEMLSEVATYVGEKEHKANMWCPVHITVASYPNGAGDSEHRPREGTGVFVEIVLSTGEEGGC